MTDENIDELLAFRNDVRTLLYRRAILVGNVDNDGMWNVQTGFGRGEERPARGRGKTIEEAIRQAHEALDADEKGQSDE